MHKLCRSVRFSINPFLAEDRLGCNSFCSKPAGQGLAIFLELNVALVGRVGADTGFVVNVVDIDKCVRRQVVPVFAERLRKEFAGGKHIGWKQIAELLKLAKTRLTNEFGQAHLAELTLNLNPFRKASIDCEDDKMIYISEKFEFAATHKLWNDEFSEAQNFETFGKCANPSGHGHNYILEVTVKTAVGDESFDIGGFEKIIDDNLIQIIDHKNLNVDVDRFSRVNPTMENITTFAWNSLIGKFNNAALHCVTVWETDKTFCSYYG